LEITQGFKHHRDIYAGCQRYAYENDWKVRVEPAVDRDLKSGRLTNCDGIIARATSVMKTVADSRGIPLVNVWLMSKVSLPSVFPDTETSGQLAAEHLLSRGMQQFGFVGFTRFKGQSRLQKGFRTRLKEAGYSAQMFLTSHRAPHGVRPAWENFYDNATQWLEGFTPPFALFVGSDLIARHLIGFCEMKGLTVPGDVIVMSYGNEATICELSPPTLTSVDGDNDRIGYEAAQLLDRLMSGAKPPSAPILIPPIGVIARQTTDFYVSDDPLVADCLRLIADRLDQRLRVNLLAQELGVSRRSLERRFSASIGQSIAMEISRLRVQQAKRRLVRTKDSIKSIARECGFSGSNHLCAAFRRVMGMKPSEYRALQEGRDTA